MPKTSQKSSSTMTTLRIDGAAWKMASTTSCIAG
tara:strand:- start:12 stop:113 length:102 start_codon:yes stop_codon:yes gene_type:complete